MTVVSKRDVSRRDTLRRLPTDWRVQLVIAILLILFCHFVVRT